MKQDYTCLLFCVIFGIAKFYQSFDTNRQIFMTTMPISRYAFFLLPVFLLGGVLLHLTWPNAAQAGNRHLGYCDDVKNTAGTAKCVKEHYDHAAIRLNESYNAVYQMVDAALKDTLQDAQAAWIAYRDQHCAWEESLPQTSGLDHVYKLSCEAALTEKRAEILEDISARETADGPPEIGAAPRWTNLLVQQHTNIFWNLNSSTHFDLDCDGAAEEIIFGTEIITDDMAGKNEQSGTYITFAVIDNKRTGTPDKTLIRAPIRMHKSHENAAPDEDAQNNNTAQTDTPDTADTKEDSASSSAPAPVMFCASSPALSPIDMQPLLIEPAASGTSAPAAKPATKPVRVNTQDTLNTDPQNPQQTTQPAPAATQACYAGLQITHGNCRPLYLYLKDGTYQFSAL